MKLHISKMDTILFVSAAFTMALLVVRIIYTGELVYAFYPWNLLLALVPLLASRRVLNQTRFSLKALVLLAIWLLFFPNAPYLITDLFHFTERKGCPPWFDLILVSSASWNGIIVAVISLLQVETFVEKHFAYRRVQLIIVFFIVLGGYGVYLGRFIRFNSWDIVTNPGNIAYYIKNSLVHPRQNLSAWAFTIVFSFLFGIIFFTIKGLKEVKERSA